MRRSAAGQLRARAASFSSGRVGLRLPACRLKLRGQTFQRGHETRRVDLRPCGGELAVGGEGFLDRGQGLFAPPQLGQTAGLVVQRRGEVGQERAGARGLAASGRLRPLVGREYPLTQASIAHTDLRTRRSVGKLVLDSSR